MVNKNKKLTNNIFSAIACVAAVALFFLVSNFFKVKPESANFWSALFLVSAPLVFEMLGAIYLGIHRFDYQLHIWRFISPKTVINLSQWISGLFGIAAVFDLSMRIYRKAPWMDSGNASLYIDVPLIVLVLFWALVSRLSEDDLQVKLYRK